MWPWQTRSTSGQRIRGSLLERGLRTRALLNMDQCICLIIPELKDHGWGVCSARSAHTVFMKREIPRLEKRLWIGLAKSRLVRSRTGSVGEVEASRGTLYGLLFTNHFKSLQYLVRKTHHTYLFIHNLTIHRERSRTVSRVMNCT